MFFKIVSLVIFDRKIYAPKQWTERGMNVDSKLPK